MRISSARLWALLALPLASCTMGSVSPPDTPPPAPADGGRAVPDAGAPIGPIGGSDAGVDGLDGLPKGAAQLAILCARNHGDVISKAFCSNGTPTIASLKDLQTLLGLGLDPTIDFPSHGINPAFAISGHSSSLSKRLTSAVNPRVILMSKNGEGRHTPPNPALPNFVSMAFGRGEQFVELAAQDQGTLRFFLFTFDQACNSAPGGCTPNDLYTPAVESNFVNYTLYEDVDVSDTPMDCLQCHQPNGPGTTRILRMQELQAPWTHFFQDASATATGSQGLQLLGDFQAAHRTAEDYGTLRASMFTNGSKPQYMEGAVEAQSGQALPGEFLGLTIENELTNANAPCSSSPTWNALYLNAVNGNDIPAPDCRERITDPVKLAAATQAYASWRVNPATVLPDMSDVMLDQALVDMGVFPLPGQSGNGILVQICQECHNSRLDQTLSRARFNVETLSSMSRAEKDEAIRRLNLPKTDPNHMPPQRFKELSASDIATVTQVLMQ